MRAKAWKGQQGHHCIKHNVRCWAVSTVPASTLAVSKNCRQQVIWIHARSVSYIHNVQHKWIYNAQHSQAKLESEVRSLLVAVWYGSATPVRYYPSSAPIFLWPPLSCWRQSRAFLSSSGLYLGSPPPNDWRRRTGRLRGKPGWERLKTICACSISAWRWKMTLFGR